MLTTGLKAVAAAALCFASGAVSASAAPVQWTSGTGANDHWYEYVSSPTTWAGARDAAALSSFMGLTGYLATITSAAEYAFIKASVSSATGWVGGSDEGVEGNWEWLTGPEAGTPFVYAPWNGGEPNNVGNEDYLLVNFNQGGWNDAPTSYFSGYFVEYNGSAPPAAVPLPATMPLLTAALGGLVLLRRRHA